MLFRRRRFDADLTEELRAHLAEREAAYIREGLTPADALRRARLSGMLYQSRPAEPAVLGGVVAILALTALAAALLPALRATRIEPATALRRN